MAAQSSSSEEDPLIKYMRSQAKGALEINPGSPLIRGLLARVLANNENNDDPNEVGGDDEELEAIVKTLLDVTLVRSGFEVSDLEGLVIYVVFSDVFLEEGDVCLRGCP